MTNFDERIESLSKFSPKPVIEIIDEENEVEYILTFMPQLNILIVKRSDTLDEPPIAISYGTFARQCNNISLNKKNVLDRVIVHLVAAWGKTSKEHRMSFFNSVPLNSLFIGRQYV